MWTRPRAISTPAPHSAGERLDLRAAPLDQVDSFEHVVDVLLALGLGDAVELGVDAEVLFDGEVGVAGERLGNDADHAANRIGILGHIVAGDDGLAAGEGNQRGHHADQRALARAVGAEQAEDLALGDREADALDGFKVAVALDDVLDRNGRLRSAVPVAVWPIAAGASLLHQLALGDVDLGGHAGDEALAGIVDEQLQLDGLDVALAGCSTSRWVAKSASAALLMTLPCKGCAARA